MKWGENIVEEAEREEILKTIRPQTIWKGEPDIGGWYTEAELTAVMTAIQESMEWTVGFTARRERQMFGQAFADYVNTAYALPINGGGTGLDMAIMCLDVAPGDEIISCATNFVGTHLAIIGQGAQLVLCEPDPKTLNLDPEDVERRITSKTRAILATHMNGLSADMDALLEIAERHPHPKHGPLKVIGDAARSCGATYKETRVGKKGWLNVFSFQRKKLMTTLGEGGMVTTDDSEVADKIDKLHSFGGGESWGTNYKMSKIQAAVGLVQLARLDEMNQKRVALAKQRTELLQHIPELTLPTAPPGYGHAYYVYTIMVAPSWAGEKRDRLIQILEQEYKIGCSIANAPTYTQNRLIQKHTQGQKMLLAEEIGARLFCPSLHPLMTEEENKYVIAALSKTVERLRSER